MKTIKRYSVIFTALALFMLAGCEKDFDKINTNPNAPTEASTAALLSQAIRDLAYNDFDVWYSARQSDLACQHFSQRNYTSEDRYSFRVNVTDGFFRNNYLYLNNLQQIINLNTDPATKDKYAVLYGSNTMQIAVAEIMKSWGLQLLTDYFGDIPYKQALQLEKYPQPAYDPQKDVYDGLISTLDKAAADLTVLNDEGASGFTSGDLLYNGDLSQWIKFANSLRLRLALRASNVDASYLAIAQDAIADGVFESNDDNARCEFSTSGAPNEAPWYNGFFVSGRNDFSFCQRFIETLKGNSYLNWTNPFEGIQDPRYPVLTLNAGYTKFGVPYGMSDGQTQSWWSTSGSSKRISLYNTANPLTSPNFPSTFLDYPTVCFMVSEIEGWDADWFRNGIVASLEQWGAEDNGYVDAVMAKFADATTEQKKEMVITQKYIHLVKQSAEAWAEYRRTGYPKSLVKPGEVTYVKDDGTEIVFTPVPGSESGADIVARFKYPSSEYTLNETNVKAAVVRMGEDSHAQRVWWDGGGKQ
ncbi:MAG TPA: SusD/RagB family nutrient-binding outer membrane lipoprotein [Bacteroidales bacterium]|nr:SusD/RagB family nutrient-binding outer membrane lipoprotein [Bacteroidales bacterium]